MINHRRARSLAEQLSDGCIDPDIMNLAEAYLELKKMIDGAPICYGRKNDDKIHWGSNTKQHGSDTHKHRVVNVEEIK